MKIELSKLKPNPYRDLKKYPTDPEKIERLKASIEQTGFWDNLLARQVNGHFELAYGHNRFVALQELGIKDIDIPVKVIADADMVRIMATENREQWEQTPSIIVETVQAVRDFLNSELTKYTNWESFEKSELNKSIKFNNSQTFSSAKGNKGIGQTIILKFLGKGWQQWKIQNALDALDSNEISIKAFTTFESTGMATAFKDEIKKINKERQKHKEKPLNEKEQIKIAQTVNQQLNESKNINKDTGKKGIAPGKTGGGNYYKAIKNIVRKEAGIIDPEQNFMNEIAFEIDGIEKDAGKLANKIAGLNGLLHTKKITELKTVSTLNLINSFSQLLTNANVLTNTLGIQFNSLLENTNHENEN